MVQAQHVVVLAWEEGGGIETAIGNETGRGFYDAEGTHEDDLHTPYTLLPQHALQPHEGAPPGYASARLAVAGSGLAGEAPQYGAPAQESVGGSQRKGSRRAQRVLLRRVHGSGDVLGFSSGGWEPAAQALAKGSSWLEERLPRDEETHSVRDGS